MANIQNIRKAERYKTLAIVDNIKPDSVKKEFWRKGLDVMNENDIKEYLTEKI